MQKKNLIKLLIGIGLCVIIAFSCYMYYRKTKLNEITTDALHSAKINQTSAANEEITVAINKYGSSEKLLNCKKEIQFLSDQRNLYNKGVNDLATGNISKGKKELSQISATYPELKERANQELDNLNTIIKPKDGEKYVGVTEPSNSYGLYIFKSPNNTSEPPIASVNSFEKINVLEIEGLTFKVEFKGKIGYVNASETAGFGDIINNISATEKGPSVPSTPKGTIYIKQNYSVPLCEKPNMVSEYLVGLSQGATLQYYEEVDGWYLVKYTDDLTGFVKASWVTTNKYQ